MNRDDFLADAQKPDRSGPTSDPPTQTPQPDKKATGIFYRKDREGVSVLLDGQEVFRYPTIDELVRTHIKAVHNLRKVQQEEAERIFGNQYKSIPD
jgi:hypothetical protein